MAIDKCIHVAKNPEMKRIRITPQSTGGFFELCSDCYEIWNVDRRRNPLESEAYNVYRTTDPNLPKDQWIKVNDKPIPPTPDGKVQYLIKNAPEGIYYVTAINGIGLESHPSKVPETDAPRLVLKSLLTFKETTDEGKLIEAVSLPWFDIIKILGKDPEAAFSISDRTWEEIIAGAYHRAGFDEVILTPRSGDYGRDVIAVKKGVGTIRIIDQVKAYKRGHLVDANDVRALVGVLHGDGASKGFLTTTSDFAPRLKSDPLITPFMPSRLELINGEQLLKRLLELR
jgi:restriction system protein